MNQRSREEAERDARLSANNANADTANSYRSVERLLLEAYKAAKAATAAAEHAHFVHGHRPGMSLDEIDAADDALATASESYDAAVDAAFRGDAAARSAASVAANAVTRWRSLRLR